MQGNNDKNAKKTSSNHVSLKFKSLDTNVALARLVVSALASEEELTLFDLEEIKVAVSEAVSNAIIHGYQNDPNCWVDLIIELENGNLTVHIIDKGVGIKDIALAMQPHFSGSEDADGRMGLGFSFMQSFMDKVDVISTVGQGTTIILSRNLRAQHLNINEDLFKGELFDELSEISGGLK